MYSLLVQRPLTNASRNMCSMLYLNDQHDVKQHEIGNRAAQWIHKIIMLSIALHKKAFLHFARLSSRFTHLTFPNLLKLLESDMEHLVVLIISEPSYTAHNTVLAYCYCHLPF